MKIVVTKRARKPAYERAVKTSVSMPGTLMSDGKQKMRQSYHLTQFSDYVQLLIRRDISEGMVR